MRAWVFLILWLVICTLQSFEDTSVAATSSDAGDVDLEFDNKDLLGALIGVRKRGKKKKDAPRTLLPPPAINHNLDSLSDSKSFRKIKNFWKMKITESHLDENNKNNIYDPKRGFEMGVLASLSYWDFHKTPAPNNATGFALKDHAAANASNRNDKLDKLQRWARATIRDSLPIRAAHTFRERNNFTSVWKDDGNDANNFTSNHRKQHHDSYSNHHSHSSFSPRYYSFDYFFYDWYEPTGVKGLRFHDTDVLISTTSSQEKAGSFPDTLVVAFAGTASVADAVTNVQTFEPANHSKFFEPRSFSMQKGLRRKLWEWIEPNKEPSAMGILREKFLARIVAPTQPSSLRRRLWEFLEPSQEPSTAGRWRQRLWNALWLTRQDDSNAGAASSSKPTKIQGSLHRGFLNAYSRVEHGSVLKLARGNPQSHEQQQQMPPKVNWWKERNNRPGNRKAVRVPILNSLDRRFGHCQGNDSLETFPETERSEEDDKANRSNDNDSTIDDISETIPKKKRKKSNVKKKQKRISMGGCKITKDDQKAVPLAVILKELVNDALHNGYTVHITGHSLGGALATLLVLDVLVNNQSAVNSTAHPPPTDKLFLWTFGAPQVADNFFWESIQNLSPLLRRFFKGGLTNRLGFRLGWNRNRNRSHVHRYVTLSDDGKADAVSEVAKNTLAAHKESLLSSATPDSNDEKIPVQDADENPISKRRGNNILHKINNNPQKGVEKGVHKKRSKSSKRRRRWWTKGAANRWHGRVAQSLGGVSRGGEVTHFVDAHYLWTPDQHKQQLKHHQEQHQMKQQQQEPGFVTQTSDNLPDDICEKEDDERTTAKTTTDTRSSMAAHSMRNYLMGISRESVHHPLAPDVPLEWLEFLEIAPVEAE